MQNLIERLEIQKDFWNVSVTPQVVFDFDSIEFNSYKELSHYLNLVIQSKADLITLLHFWELDKINRDIFYNVTKIDVTEIAKTNNFNEQKDKANDLRNKLHQQFNYESEDWWGELLDAWEEKKAYKMDFTSYILEDAKKDTKQIPRDEDTQKQYLSDLIDQWFFDVLDNYNDWKEHLTDIPRQLANFNCWGNYESTYRAKYRSRALLEAYKRWKLSDIVLQYIIDARVSWSQANRYEEDIIKFTYMIRLQYPDLSQKMIAAIGKYIANAPTWHREEKNYPTTWDFIEAKDKY